MTPSSLQIVGVDGLPEFRPGDDLAAAIAERAGWLADGDVVVVTSKVVSKVEGRLIPTTPTDREADRKAAVDAETVRVVAAYRGGRIVRTRHGLVLAAAGVDASNVAGDELALLPVDPDASARALRASLRKRLGVRVAVIVSDTAGRPWRLGVTDHAIGVAGIAPILSLRGRHDSFGNELQVTEVAVADEVAAATDLVKGKLAARPVAIVRGLADDALLLDDGPGASAIVRSSAEDLFSLGTAEAVELGRGHAAVSASVAALHADATALLSRYADTANGPQRSIAEAMLGFLSARADGTARCCEPGHVTASALVTDRAGGAVLLTLHPRVDRWMQLGGHIEESDASVVAAALREGTEESGIDGLRIDPDPIHLAVHPITCSLGKPTRHFDIRFVASAPDGALPTISAESDDLRWFDLDALPAAAADDLPDLIAAARRRLRG